jgi:hypothetical protein
VSAQRWFPQIESSPSQKVATNERHSLHNVVNVVSRYLREGRHVVVDDGNANEGTRLAYTTKAREVENELTTSASLRPDSTRIIRTRLVIFLPEGGLMQCMWQAELWRATQCASLQFPEKSQSHQEQQQMVDPRHVAPEDEWIPWLSATRRDPVPAVEGFHEVLHRRTKLIMPFASHSLTNNVNSFVFLFLFIDFFFSCNVINSGSYSRLCSVIPF